MNPRVDLPHDALPHISSMAANSRKAERAVSGLFTTPGVLLDAEDTLAAVIRDAQAALRVLRRRKAQPMREAQHQPHC